jgi:hypothetical protein
VTLASLKRTGIEVQSDDELVNADNAAVGDYDGEIVHSARSVPGPPERVFHGLYHIREVLAVWTVTL